MAIAVEVTFTGTGATKNNYDKQIARLGAFPGGSHPDPGCLFHWVQKTPGGLLVTDVWKNQEYFDLFKNQILIPASAGSHLPQPNVGPFIEVHNFLTAG